MLLSFNKFSRSALTAPIYHSVEETLQEKTRKSNLNFVHNFIVSQIIYCFVCVQYHMIVSSGYDNKR